MKKLKYLLLVISVFALNACSSFSKMPNYSEKAFDSGENAVVFFNVVQMQPKGEFITIPYHLALYQNDNPKKKQVFFIPQQIEWNWLLTGPTYYKQQDVQNFNRNCHKNFLFLKPGIYYIDFIQLLSEDYILYHMNYSCVAPGCKDNAIIYGAFEVKAGDVLNLGTFVVKHDYGSRNSQFFHEYGNIKQIKSYLFEKNKPHFAERVKNGKFFMKGSAIDKDEDGNNKIISQQELKEKNLDAFDNYFSDQLKENMN